MKSPKRKKYLITKVLRRYYKGAFKISFQRSFSCYTNTHCKTEILKITMFEKKLFLNYIQSKNFLFKFSW